MLASDVLASGDESIERDGMEQLHRLLNDLSDIPHTTKPAPARRKSRDFFWYRPMLNRQLHDCMCRSRHQSSRRGGRDSHRGRLFSA